MHQHPPAISQNLNTHFGVIVEVFILEVSFECLSNIRNICEVRSEKAELLGGSIRQGEARGLRGDGGKSERLEVSLCEFQIGIQPTCIDLAIFEGRFIDRRFIERPKETLNSFCRHRLAIRGVLRIIPSDDHRAVRFPR